MASKLKVIVIGHITLDEYNGQLIPGGSAYYCSQTYIALGAQVRLISTVGDDFQFDEVFDGMDINVKRKGKTTHFKNTYKENLFREQISLAQAEPIVPDVIPESFLECDILHLVPVLGEIDIKQWVSFIKAKYVAIGLQGWVRTINSSKIVHPKMCDITDSDFKSVDIVCLSDQDIHHQQELLDRMIKLVRVVTVTHGRDGYTIYKDGGKQSYGAYRTIEIDPTGAGDVFATGFVHGIASKMSVEKAGYVGAGLASVIVEDTAGNAFDRITEGIQRARSISSSQEVNSR